jgi:dienelactone hydrolase
MRAQEAARQRTFLDSARRDGQTRHVNDLSHQFSTLPSIQRRWKGVGRKQSFNVSSIAQWRAWHRSTRKKLRKLIGYDTFEQVPLRPRITEQLDCGDFIRQRVEIATERDVVMPLFVLIPKTATSGSQWTGAIPRNPLADARSYEGTSARPKFPVVICPHGHVSGGKVAVAGVRDNPDVAKTITQHNYDYGAQLCRAGFITFCPDARGMGERQEAAARSHVFNASCQWLNQMALPLGRTVTGMWTWDLHRLIDYVETRKDCDAKRIGCAGLSGGGLQTLWASALDERIRCAVISGYFYGCKESLLDMHTHCSCNYVPHLWEHVDMGDIAALIAPRPLLVETGARDPLNGASGLKNVESQMRIIRRAYRLLKMPQNLKHDIFDGEHRWHGVEAIPWMKKFL